MPLSKKSLNPLISAILALFTFSVVIGLNQTLSPPSQAETTNQSNLPEERILSYQSEMVVNEDASLDVVETITVKATGDEIQRGIYRDVQLEAPFQPGQASYEVVDVLRNGDSTHYWLENLDNKKRINIYDPDVEIDPGNYTYTIQYETERQLDFSQGDTDRLYWNVTGQNWTFPIDQVRTKVFLPNEIPEEEIQLDAFTGTEGAKGESYEAQLDGGGNPTFATTHTLAPQEGLSIIVDFPSGYVERPGFLESLYYAFVTFIRALVATLIFFVTFFLLIFTAVMLSGKSSGSSASGIGGTGGGSGGFGGGGGGGGSGGGGGGCGGGGA
ncbi:DUF2207 domain-containing protein [Euhalothece natronophila Z-M001]|uniref:DUF2207 domain-containing protein n=1 Tax=Euhalothece natronophila Z-M001 TaxID=522448 RepID=A0A5B8NMV2_9CHRO|nr:DUF2207 domain-containing protein [Euhalothece natronophila]QDZ40257.1 DUF2207 domain-containing protein [Euhalothece natronophila Z-M001]